MNQKVGAYQRKASIKNSTLILIGFATAFFPRLLSSFGAPSPINFVHFLVVPIAFGVVLTTTRITNPKQIKIVWSLLTGLGILLVCTLTSALINEASAINLFLQYILQAEPFLLLVAIMAIPFVGKSLSRFRNYLLGFALFNLLLAIAQSILLPMGIYPKPSGGTLQDNITGVFGGGGGSAANYVSCTVSFYFALYFFNRFKHLSLWVRILPLLAAVYQIQVSDSKQVFLALAAGWGLLVATKVEKPVRMLGYASLGLIAVLGFAWALLNLESDFLQPYQNWVNRPIWGWHGLAAQTKFAALEIVPSYFETPLNFLFGLGPGHTASRLGGWILRDYEELLVPLGATLHPASADFWRVVETSYLPQESTVYFPLFTWIGIWGDLGILGLGSYLYLCSVVWRKLCLDDFGKFLLLSSASFGFILTQMEEPGHMLSVACLLGLCWLEAHEKRSLTQVVATPSQVINNE